MPCVAVSHPFCVVWIWMFLTKKLLTFKSYLNDRKNPTPFTYTSGPLLNISVMFVPLSWSTFVLYVCWIIYIVMSRCLGFFCFVLFFYRFCVHLCTVPHVILLFSCIIYLFWLWISSVSLASQVICGGGWLGWELCKDDCTHKAINQLNQSIKSISL